MAFYVPLGSGTDALQQGDILVSVPFTYFSIRNVKVALDDGSADYRDLTEDPSGVRYLIASVVFGWGMIVSQTCDLQPDPQTGNARKPIIVARVRPIQELVRDFPMDNPKASRNKVKALANPGRYPSVFYLPAYPGGGVQFPPSGADLLDTQRFGPNDLPAIRRLLRLRLDVPALQALQERCAYCFGRFAAPEGLFLSDAEKQEDERIGPDRGSPSAR